MVQRLGHFQMNIKVPLLFMYTNWTDQGRTDVKEVKVVNNKITLTASAATPYVVVPKRDKGLEILDYNWGKGCSYI